uniref:Coatomer subunit zeta n=1 Tax=Micromonas pusilla TaxID=38833 RepID=A0A7S0ICA6_MICPS
MVLAGRVLCVMMASASGHVILERFYDPISEPDQMRWRDRLHRAEASSGAGASTVAESDCDKLATRCGVARHGDENMVWCGVGDLRFYAVGSEEYDEYTLAEVLQALASSVKGIVKKGFTEAHAFEHYGMICLALDEIVSDGVVEATTWDTIRRAIKLKMAD